MDRDGVVQLVVKAWKANDKLVLLGAGGIMARVSNNTELDREELSSNHEILAPIIQHMGSLAKDMINLTNCFCEMSCYNYRVKNHLHILRLETIYRSAWSKCGAFPTSLQASWKETTFKWLVSKYPTAIMIDLKWYHKSPHLFGYYGGLFWGRVVRAEAWILRKLVYLFNRTAKRGHRPREEGIRKLMEVAGIDIPDISPRGPRETGLQPSILSISYS